MNDPAWIRYWAFYAAQRPGMVEYCTGQERHRITAEQARAIGRALLEAADEADERAAKSRGTEGS